jgi:hypothetical protein
MSEENDQTASQPDTDAAVSESTQSPESSDSGTILGGDSTETASADSATEASAEVKDEPIVYDLTAEGAPESAVSSVIAYAKEHGLSNEQAQAQLSREVALEAAARKSAVDELESTKADWAEQTRSLPDIGGDNYETSLRMAKEALQFANVEGFSEFLEETKLGNHPMMFQFLHKFGLAMQDDTTLIGKEAQAPKSTAEIMYPNL